MKTYPLIYTYTEMLISIRITKLYILCRGLHLISIECMHIFFIKLVFCMKMNQKNSVVYLPFQASLKTS